MQSVSPSNESSLANHKKSAYMGKKFQCQECDYEATLKGSLAVHTQGTEVSVPRV